MDFTIIITGYHVNGIYQCCFVVYHLLGGEILNGCCVECFVFEGSNLLSGVFKYCLPESLVLCCQCVANKDF